MHAHMPERVQAHHHRLAKSPSGPRIPARIARPNFNRFKRKGREGFLSLCSTFPGVVLWESTRKFHKVRYDA